MDLRQLEWTCGIRSGAAAAGVERAAALELGGIHRLDARFLRYLHPWWNRFQHERVYQENRLTFTGRLMKLRIHGNSLRLRISEADLTRLRWEGRLECWMGLGPGRRFTYSVEANESSERITAVYESDSLTLLMPRTWIDGWNPSDEEARFESMQDIDGDQQLHIVVEKDLLCKHGGQNQRVPDEAAA